MKQLLSFSGKNHRPPRTIRYLIDGKTEEISHQNSCDAFGLGLTDEIPYAYFGKRYDPETNLVYFGKRYYDPSHKRWLTPDPLGPVDHSNLYQFVFNNPYRYFDPDGQFVLALPLLIWGAELAIPTLSAMAAPVIYGAITGAVIYGGYKVAQIINNTCQASNWVYQPVGGCPQAWVMVPKNIDVFVPDRPLPLTEDGIPIPEADVPHTELGTRDGSRGKYPQARESDGHGKPVRDIDFTDHGYPKKHPNHQHRPIPNPTGGTPKRGKPEPIPEWSY